MHFQIVLIPFVSSWTRGWLGIVLFPAPSPGFFRFIPCGTEMDCRMSQIYGTCLHERTQESEGNGPDRKQETEEVSQSIPSSPLCGGSPALPGGRFFCSFF
jgi:hypothetical protein